MRSTPLNSIALRLPSVIATARTWKIIVSGHVATRKDAESQSPAHLVGLGGSGELEPFAVLMN